MQRSRTSVSQWSILLAAASAMLLVVQLSPTHAAPRHDEFASSMWAPKRPRVENVAPALTPAEEAAKLREELDLGHRRTAGELLSRGPSEALRKAAGGAGTSTLEWPVEEGFFVRGFGYVRKELKDKRHDGIDLSAPIGTPIHAAADGIVGYADDGVRGYGNLAILVHADGAVTSYAHCNRLLVVPGQRVKRGEIIAEVGTTGISRGPHVHFELRSRGRAENPLAHLAADENQPVNPRAFATALRHPATMDGHVH